MKASRSCFVKISLQSKQKDIVFQSTWEYFAEVAFVSPATAAGKIACINFVAMRSFF